MSRKLTLDDISDLRAYERERESFRASIIALKKRRRVHIGPFVTILFENRDTIRFQIQEMARVERLLSDEAIETELRTYNPLVPDPGQLALTLFIELTTEEQLREWLPKLVAIEQRLQLHIGDADRLIVVDATPEAAHASQLTRDEITASVHYLHFNLTDEQVAAVAAGPVSVALVHENYTHVTSLSADTIAELLADLRS